MPKPLKLARDAAIPYEQVAAFVAQPRNREATSALALELCHPERATLPIERCPTRIPTQEREEDTWLKLTSDWTKLTETFGNENRSFLN